MPSQATLQGLLSNALNRQGAAGGLHQALGQQHAATTAALLAAGHPQAAAASQHGTRGMLQGYNSQGSHQHLAHHSAHHPAHHQPSHHHQPAHHHSPAAPTNLVIAAALSTPAEPLEATLKRLPAGCLKRGIFETLYAAGAKGLMAAELWHSLRQQGVIAWSDPRTSKPSLTALAVGDPAVCRLADGRLVTKLAVQQANAGPGGIAAQMQRQQQRPSQAPGSADAAAASPAAAAGPQGQALGDGTMPAAGAGAAATAAAGAQGAAGALALTSLPAPKPLMRRSATLLRNSIKCASPRCLKTYQAEYSPLCLCDFCPRAYHMACMGADGVDYPSLGGAEWACPRCVEVHTCVVEGKPLPEVNVQEELQVLGDLHPDWDRLDKADKRAWEKAERDRRQAEELDARERQAAMAEASGLGAAGSVGYGGSGGLGGLGGSFGGMYSLGSVGAPHQLLPPASSLAPGGPSGQLLGDRGGSGFGLGLGRGYAAAGGSAGGAMGFAPVYSEAHLKLRERAMRRGARNDVEDQELAEEESAEVWVLEALVSELRERGATGQQTKGAETAAAATAAQKAAAAGSACAPLLAALAEVLAERPGVGRRSAKSAEELAAEAEARLQHVRLVAEGPSRCRLYAGSPEHVTAWMDAMGVAEFTHAFGPMVGVAPLGMQQLLHAAAHPLRPPRALEGLYRGLLRYSLTLWLGYGTKMVPRVRRWLRLLSTPPRVTPPTAGQPPAAAGDGTAAAGGDASQAAGAGAGRGRGKLRGGAAWQEVLRRYLLLSRSGVAVDEGDLQQPLYRMSDDLAAVQVSHGWFASRPPPCTSCKPFLSFNLLLALPCKLLHAMPMQCALESGRTAFHKLSPALHLTHAPSVLQPFSLLLPPCHAHAVCAGARANCVPQAVARPAPAVPARPVQRPCREQRHAH